MTANTKPIIYFGVFLPVPDTLSLSEKDYLLSGQYELAEICMLSYMLCKEDVVMEC